jgi:hypothetical protein
MVNLGMNEYISKEYIRNIVQKHWDDSCGAECYAYSVVLDDIDVAPIADVVEVKRGKWVWKDFGDHAGFLTLCCSECLDTCGARENASYCSNCGAKME